MGYYGMMAWLDANAPPPLTYGEIIDRLFALWCQSPDGCTFEEFIDSAARHPEP
jgi:hypothetical protein